MAEKFIVEEGPTGSVYVKDTHEFGELYVISEDGFVICDAVRDLIELVNEINNTLEEQRRIYYARFY